MSSAQFPDEYGIDIKTRLSKGLGMPVELINLSHLLAFTEHRCGKAIGMKSFLYMHSGYGLGIFLNGKLYRGHQGQAGEIGWMRISDDGPRGRDGRVGLFGDVAPLYKITDRLEDIIAANGNTLAKKYMEAKSRKVDLSMVVAAIKDGDLLCAQMLNETFRSIGNVVLDLAYIFNPEAVFFEPWTAGCPEHTIEVVRRQMSHYGVHHWGLKTEVLSAVCGNESLARGAALIPIERKFGNEAA
jgi:predicted NBD/HSP70 family sugar kinase